MPDWNRNPATKAGSHVPENQFDKLLALLAEAVHRHPDEVWAKRAQKMFPDLAKHYTPSEAANEV